MKNRIAYIVLIVFIIILGVWIWSSMAENKDVSSLPDEDKLTVVEEERYYRIVQSEYLYYCQFYDRDSHVIKTEGPMNKQPRVAVVDDSLIRFTLQAGTGTGTQWGYYYNTNDGSFSAVFQCIFDQFDGLVAYACADRIVVRDIFDKKGYYQEFDDFRYPFSETAERFTDVCFAEKDMSIEISYLSGDNYQIVTECFPLPGYPEK